MLPDGFIVVPRDAEIKDWVISPHASIGSAGSYRGVSLELFREVLGEYFDVRSVGVLKANLQGTEDDPKLDVDDSHISDWMIVISRKGDPTPRLVLVVE